MGKINLEMDGTWVAYWGITPSGPRLLEKERARPSSGMKGTELRRELGRVEWA